MIIDLFYETKLMMMLSYHTLKDLQKHANILMQTHQHNINNEFTYNYTLSAKDKEYIQRMSDNEYKCYISSEYDILELLTTNVNEIIHDDIKHKHIFHIILDAKIKSFNNERSKCM